MDPTVYEKLGRNVQRMKGEVKNLDCGLLKKQIHQSYPPWN